MGANFDSRTYDGDMSKAEVQKAFNDAQDDAQSYYGNNPYNGSISNCDRTIQFRSQVFDNENDAYDALMDVEKRAVVAVRAWRGGKQVWFIGTWCPE